MVADEVRVLLVQTVIREAMTGPLFEHALEANLHRSIALIDKSARRNGAPNIVVLPEFFLTGLSSTRSHEACLEMARRVPGPETDALGAVAAEHGMYIAGATWEFDPEWPDRWFNTAFIVGPSGRVELKYRKINEGNYQLGLTDTTPGDIYDDYVDRYGEASLWPVLETDLGTLACVICFDLNFAETTRMLALRGAEIILNPTGEPYGEHRQIWEDARRTRAFENLCYWVSANHGGYHGTLDGRRYVDDPDRDLFSARVRGGITPADRSHGGSEVVDHRGKVVAKIDGQGEATLEAVLDMRALRHARSQWPAELPTAQSITPELGDLYAKGYDVAPGFPLNKLRNEPLHFKADGPRHLQEVVAALQESSMVPPPSSGATSPTVLAFQADVPFVHRDADEAARLAAVRESVRRTGELLESEIGRGGADFVVLPDGWPLSFLPGRPGGSAGGLPLPGPEIEVVCEWAAAHGVHVAGAVLERTPPDRSGEERICRSAYIIDDRGSLIHHHRALVPPGAVGYEPGWTLAAPGAADDDTAGLRVCRTRHGGVATLIGREILSVELTRLLATAGAEIVVNPMAEYDVTFTVGLRQARAVRASENCVYVVSAGQGQLVGPVPSGASLGSSAIVEPSGELVAAIDDPRTAGISSRLDLDGLRRRRQTGRMNKLIQLRPRLYAPTYRGIGSGLTTVAQPPEMAIR